MRFRAIARELGLDPDVLRAVLNPTAKRLDMTQEHARELFEYVCDQEMKGYRLATFQLRLDLAYTAGIVDRKGRVVDGKLA